MEGNKRDS